MSKKPEELTYADTGVDRDLRAESKKGLVDLEKLYRFSPYGKPVELPYDKIIPISKTEHPLSTKYMNIVIEGIGTKVLLAQLADNYETICVDGVAMCSNDLVRQGEGPCILVDALDVQKSDPYFINELKKGIIKGAEQSESFVPGGEIADVRVLVKSIKEDKGFIANFAGVSFLRPVDVIWGKNIKPGDAIVGARSSGIHSNGISMVREVLFKEWGGYYKDPFVKLDELEDGLIMETLKPTQIYVKPVEEANRKIDLKAAVHVTGDAYEKFKNLFEFSPGIGFEFTDLRPQPIFGVIQETAKKLGRYITNKEMVNTFNLGTGFAEIVSPSEKDHAIDILEKHGIEAWQVGEVTDSAERIIVHYNNEKIQLV